ncbi:Flp pilus assembly secretin CpaC [Bradyrhizobium sp. GM24.11]
MTRLPRAALLALTLLASAPWCASAADQIVTMRLGANSTLSVARSFKTVLIDDPFVVEVHEQSDRSVVLEPLDLGAANLIFVDERSIAIANVRVVVCARTTRVSYSESGGCE